MRTECLRTFGRTLILALAGLLAACGGSSGGGGSPPPAVGGQEFFINGADNDTASSFWACTLPENVGTDIYWVVAFYTDATGYYLGQNIETSMTWSYTEPDVAFQLDGDANQFEFKSVERLSALEFNTDLLLNGAVVEQRNCQRYNRDGTRSRSGGIAPAPIPRGRDSLVGTSGRL